MKFETNFVHQADKYHGAAIIFLWLMSFVIAGNFGYLYFQLGHKGEKTREYEQSYQELSRRLVEMRDNSNKPPSSSEINALNERVKVINSIIPEKGRPVESVFHLLEKILPKQVYIKTFNYKKKTGKVTLTLESKRDSQINNFLKIIESEELLTQVRMITKNRIKRNKMEYVNTDVSFYVLASSRDVL